MIPDQGLTAGGREERPLDMAGNVFEWTLTRWGAEIESPGFGWPLVPGDGRDDPGGRRPARGPWWFLDEHAAFLSRRLGTVQK